MIVAGCGFTHGTAPVAGTPIAIVDDTAADFAAGAPTDATIDPLGLVAPDAFARGGLHARAFTTWNITAATTWDQLTPDLLGPQAGERYGEVPATSWEYDRPYGLGLANRTDWFTVVYDGEIYLPAGTTVLSLVADDLGFFEIAGNLVRGKAGTTPAPVPVTVEAAGWYPIRGAMSEYSGTARFVLSTVDGGIATPIRADRLRARVTAAHGAIVVGADDRMLQDLQAGSSVEAQLVDTRWAALPPSYDLHGISGGDYSLRYAAQLRIDVAGTYVFTFDLGGSAGDYARLFIDDQIVASHWPGEPEKPGETIELAPGWHDLLLDYADQASSRLQLVMSGPDQLGAPIAAARLRPVQTGGLLASVVGPTTALADAAPYAPGVTVVDLPIDAPADAVVDFLDFSFVLQNAHRTEVAAELAQPAGADELAMTPEPTYEGTWDYMPDLTKLVGAPVAGTWQAVFFDRVPSGGNAGQVAAPALVASYHGGPLAPFAQTMTYTSAPHALDGARTLDAVHVTADLRGAALVVEVRTAPDADSLAAAPWVAVGDATPDALLQYRLTVVGTGWQYATIDRVEIDYTQ